jgi:acetyl esterase/lipase
MLKIMTYLSAMLSITQFIRPTTSAGKIFLWLPKLLGGALSPILGITSVFGALLGLTHRNWKLAGAGLLGAGLAAKFLADIPSAEDQFSATFGNDWQERVDTSAQHFPPTKRKSLLNKPTGVVKFRRNLSWGQNPDTGKSLLADLWEPPVGVSRSGLGVIYIHGSGWRVGDKDMGTRTFFRRLAGHGHTVLDPAYTLWPQADIPSMVQEVNQAILWMKENGPAHGVNPKRIILMGGSAGGHLSLLAAYAPNQQAFKPPPECDDTSVRGVVAFYPPVDLLAIYEMIGKQEDLDPNPINKTAFAIMRSIFMVGADAIEEEVKSKFEYGSIFTEMIGGTPDEIPEAYQLLSPIQHVGPHCPPTLLLQGSDDVFDLAPGVGAIHRHLQAAGVPVILVEYPHTEHGFDLVLPQVSPVARAAISEVERFLALMA